MTYRQWENVFLSIARRVDQAPGEVHVAAIGEPHDREACHVYYVPAGVDFDAWRASRLSAKLPPSVS